MGLGPAALGARVTADVYLGEGDTAPAFAIVCRGTPTATSPDGPLIDLTAATLVFQLEFAFTVADVAQLDMVVDVYEAIERAVAHGTTLDDFKADVGKSLEEA